MVAASSVDTSAPGSLCDIDGNPSCLILGEHLCLSASASFSRDSGTRAPARRRRGPVAGLVGIDGGVVSGVMNLESSGVEAPDWRPRHDEHYHEA